jgi:hypothetical protein
MSLFLDHVKRVVQLCVNGRGTPAAACAAGWIAGKKHVIRWECSWQ